MKKLLVLALALLMLCTCAVEEEPAKQPQNDSKTEEPQEEYADYWAKEIAEKRKIVLEKIKESAINALPNIRTVFFALRRKILLPAPQQVLLRQKSLLPAPPGFRFRSPPDVH